MKKIFFYLGAAIALTMVGCDNSDDVTKSPAVDGPGVYVGSQVSTVNPNANSAIVIPIYRSNGTEALTVPVSFSAAEDAELFTFPTSVSFVSGQSKVDLAIPIDVEAMDYNVNYPFTVTLPEDVQTPYGRAGATLNALKPLTWQLWAQADYTGAWDGETKPVTIQKADQGNYFRIVAPYVIGYDFMFEWDITNKATSFAPFNADGSISIGGVSYPSWFTGVLNGSNKICWGVDFDPNYTKYIPEDKTLVINPFYYSVAPDGALGGYDWYEEVCVITEFAEGDPWE